MGRIAYVNGRYVRQAEACVHIEDRGYQFSDAVYEVWAVFDGKLADADGHFERLGRSLSELKIAAPMTRQALEVVLRETLRRNGVREGTLYLQISRGVAPRDHAFPKTPVPPAVVVTAKSLDRAAVEAKVAKGMAVVTLPENRWGRCDIKSVSLLPNVLARQTAAEAGAGEAWFVDELGLVTEGAASNAWILDAAGVLRTRDLNANILRGITRFTLMEVIRQCGAPFSEKPFTPAEAKTAKEAFITGAGALVTPVVSIDGTIIGDGRPGPVATQLRSLYIERARATAL